MRLIIIAALIGYSGQRQFFPGNQLQAFLEAGDFAVQTRAKAGIIHKYLLQVPRRDAVTCGD